MNKKISTGLCISITAVVAALTFIVTWTVSLGIYNSKTPGVDRRGVMNDKISEIDSYVRGNFSGKLSESSLLSGVMSGYLSGLSDVNARYYTAEENYRKKQLDSGSIVSTGITAAGDGSGYLVVSRVYKDSPADLAGIAAADTITGIDGIDLIQSNIDEKTAQSMLAGEEGTRVKIDYQHAGEAISKTVTRSVITIPTIYSVMLNEKIGYMRIPLFNDLSSERFTDVFDEMELRGASQLIIDLRGNGSMNYKPLRDILERLLPAGQYAAATYKNDISASFIETTLPDESNIQIAVLTDGNTAYAAELFACLLRDAKNAVFVGSVTAGKPWVVGHQDFKDGSGVEVTVATVKSVKSGDYSGVGLVPMYPVESSVTDTGDRTSSYDDIDGYKNIAADGSSAGIADLQLRKAVEILAG